MGLEWSFLVTLWNALGRICLYLKMQSKKVHLLMLCVATVKPWVKCQTHSCEVCEVGYCSKEESNWWDTRMTANTFLQTPRWIAFFELLHSYGLLSWILSLSLLHAFSLLLAHMLFFLNSVLFVSLFLLAALGFLLQGHKGSSKG